jgi:hypothetical protein
MLLLHLYHDVKRRDRTVISEYERSSICLRKDITLIWMIYLLISIDILYKVVYVCTSSAIILANLHVQTY